MRELREHERVCVMFVDLMDKAPATWVASEVFTVSGAGSTTPSSRC